MHRTRVKFCGITSAGDARGAADAGADAVGLVFYRKAPRCVSEAVALEAIRAVPPFVTAVGLFVDATAEEIRDVLSRVPLGMVQLHGHEPPETVAALKPTPVLKAIRINPATIRGELQSWRAAIARLGLTNLKGFVAETAGTKEAGGTGELNDWDAVAALMRDDALEGLPPLIAAGGLTPENVGDVVRQIRPWAVDVSSGVEISKGKKSREKLIAFAKAVARADAHSA